MSTKRTKQVQRPGEPLEKALRALVTGLEASGRPSMIIGGIAVIVRGVPRLTRDIDATVAGAGTDIETLLATLKRRGIVPRINDAVSFAKQSHVLLLRHKASGIDVDLSLAWLPFELEAIAASELVPIHGARVRVARAEDLIVYKIAAWRPQDQQDVERLVALHRESLDFDRIRSFARELSTTLEEPRRVREVEKLLEHGTGTKSRDAAVPSERPSAKRTARKK